MNSITVSKAMFRFLMLIMILAISFVVFFIFPELSNYSKQEKEFTKTCHDQGGVVVEEHGTDDLLCFPANA